MNITLIQRQWQNYFCHVGNKSRQNRPACTLTPENVVLYLTDAYRAQGQTWKHDTAGLEKKKLFEYVCN